MTLQSVVSKLPRVIATVAAATGVAGCHTMARVPARYITQERPEQIFVRDAEGAVFSVNNPTIVKDSLVGTDDAGDVALNLREVDAMAVRQISKSKSIGMAAFGAGMATMITVGIARATSAHDCNRIANKNNVCLYEQSACKYGACGEQQTQGDGVDN